MSKSKGNVIDPLDMVDGISLPELLETCALAHLHVEGVFTHFCVADSKAPEDAAFTRTQYARFTAMLDALAAKGIRPELRHCASSGATILYPEFAMDMVRPGIATFGHAPSQDAEGVLDLRPLMTVRTKTAQLRTVPAGTPISYGRTFTPSRETRMAVLPIGYADGLSRSLSGKASFRIRGKDAPVIGRICMDMCMVDVTDIPGVSVGDTASALPRRQGRSAMRSSATSASASRASTCKTEGSRRSCNTSSERAQERAAPHSMV